MRFPGYVLELGSLTLWAGLVAASLWHNLALLDVQGREVAFARARMLFSILETTRLWNAYHGGVYAPVTEKSPPNEWLVDPQRDVVINGRAYTKINPAYMTRQVSELMGSQGGLSFRLTSLKPIRPGNAPDPWEEQALQNFERGKRKSWTGSRWAAPIRFVISGACWSRTPVCNAMPIRAIT